MHTSIILLLTFLRLVNSQVIDLSAAKENYYADEPVNLEIQLTNKDTKWVSYIKHGNASAF